MEDWTENLESIIEKINPLQRSKIIEIGNNLKEGLSLDSTNHPKAIKQAEKELIENFDEKSCHVLLGIIGESRFEIDYTVPNFAVDRERNQIDMKKLDNLVSKAETETLKKSNFFDFRNSNQPIQMKINLNKTG